MKTMLGACVFLACLAATGQGWSDDRGEPDAVQTFATLPEGVRFPEGIAANPHTGQIYVGTFDFGPNANKLLRYAHSGRLLAVRDFGPTPLLGLAFGTADNKLYIANMGASSIQRIGAQFEAGTPVETVAQIPAIGAPGPRIVGNPDGSSDNIVFGSSSFPAPNGMVFDSRGDLYVSDSFQGAIYRIGDPAHCANPCPVHVVVQHPLLATAGFPPFGANGLALSADETALFIANTGDDRLLKLDLGTLEITVLAESIDGADGVIRDPRGRLWVAVNQADVLVQVDANGRPVARLGAFRGLHNGTPKGLLFPASMAIHGRHIYVTNAGLPLTPAVGDEVEEAVTRWTVSRIPLPNSHGD